MLFTTSSQHPRMLFIFILYCMHWLAAGLAAKETMHVSDTMWLSPTASPTTAPTGSPAEITLSTSPAVQSPTTSPTVSPVDLLTSASPATWSTASPTIFSLNPRGELSPTASPSSALLFPVTDTPHINSNVVVHSPAKRPKPTKVPTLYPSKTPSKYPTKRPSKQPTPKPSKNPTPQPTSKPSKPPTFNPSKRPTSNPTAKPTKQPVTRKPSKAPTAYPTRKSTKTPTGFPTNVPTLPRPDNSTPYKIDFIFDNTDAETQKVFERAAKRWQQVIFKGFSSTAILERGEYCGQKIAEDTTIYDLLIYVQIASIDISGNIVAQSQACMMDTSYMVRFGVIKLDEYEVETLLAQDRLYSLVLHEMGHVLGLGSLWDEFSMVGKTKSPEGGYAYLKPFANHGNTLIGRDGSALVEDMGGRGIARGHWKESVYGTELMTGFYEATGVDMPLSKMTVLALKDLGYTVDESKADFYVAKPPDYAGRRLRGGDEPPSKRWGCLTDEYPVRQIDRIISKPGQELRFSNDVKLAQRRKGKSDVP